VSEIRELAAQLRAALAGAEPGLHDGTACAEIVEELAVTEKACAAARARFATRAAACGEHYTRRFASAPEWVARISGTSVRSARTELSTLRALEDCPATRAALDAGEVSFAQAVEIARVPGHEAELLAFARTSSLRALQVEARRRHLESLDPDEITAEQHRRREVRHWRDAFDMRRGVFALSNEFGTRFAERLDAETNRIWREARRAGRIATRDQCAADALERIVDGVAPGTGSSRGPALVIVADARAIARGEAHPGEPCHIIGGGPIPMSRVRELAAEAFVKGVIHDGTKVDTIVHVGRRRPAYLQTLLDLGPPPDFDGNTCCEEGCDRRFGLQWDHVDPVANGGTTSIDNLAPRCAPHHAQKTERDRRAGFLGGQERGGATKHERGPP
jgi:hypothetical protein